jgi:hypothetical protein
MRTRCANHKSMWQRLSVWGLSPKSRVQIGSPGPFCRGSSHPTPRYVIGKQMVNTTLVKGHHAPTGRTARNFLIFSHASSAPIHYALFFSLLGKTNIARIDSWRYTCFVRHWVCVSPPRFVMYLCASLTCFTWGMCVFRSGCHVYRGCVNLR